MCVYLVDARHDGKDGRVSDHNGLNSSHGKVLGQLLSTIERSRLGYYHLYLSFPCRSLPEREREGERKLCLTGVQYSRNLKKLHSCLILFVWTV